DVDGRFVVLVLNVGGRLGEDDNEVLKYIDGQVHSFEAVDVDMLCGGGCVNLDSDVDRKSLSYDSYESAEDEAYKPPPNGYELSSDNDSGKSKKMKKKDRTKKIITPMKKESSKKNVENTPIRRSSRRLGSQEKDGDEGLVDDGGGKGNAEEDVESTHKLKKKGSRTYARKRKEKRMPNFGFSISDFGPNSSGSHPKSDMS
ncbi:hypothetical protein PIB30_093645, partial [Stylosanthes scabra]|nr:hypothetical protein [Stylosanthes scabra]